MTLLVEHAEFWEKVDAEGDCWEWTGRVHSAGYGSFKGGLAHRFAYQALIGPIPTGYDIDHLCRNRICLNLDHLEAITHRENVRRGMAGINHRTRVACPQGHPYDTINTRLNHGRRRCRECGKREARQRRADERAGLRPIGTCPRCMTQLRVAGQPTCAPCRIGRRRDRINAQREAHDG